MLDENGNLEWNTFLGGSSFDLPLSIIATSSSNLIVAGYSYGSWGNPLHVYSGGDTDMFIATLDTNGNFKWNSFYGGIGSDSADGVRYHILSGGVVVIGRSDNSWGNPLRPYSSSSEGFVAMIDMAGSAPVATATFTATPVLATSIPPSSTPIPTPTPRNATSTPVRPTATATTSPPTSFSVIGDNSKIHLSWPSVPNTYVYKVYIECPAGAAPPEQTGNCNEPAYTNANKYVFSGLTNFVTYRVWVASVDSSGSPLLTLPAVDVVPSAGVFLSLVTNIDPCSSQDCRESNNSFNEAQPINIGERVLASLKGVAPNEDLRDFYKIQLQTGKSYVIQLKSTGNLDLDLYLYNAPNDGAKIKSSTLGNNSNEEIPFKAEPGGIHYILVVVNQKNDSRQQYELVVTEQ